MAVPAEKVVKRKPITAADIRAAMAKRWAQPEWALLWEVSDATGAVSKRYADAVMMSLWPSRGLELQGVEIKVSRGDFRREAADPRKAESVARFCDTWWLHTAPGVVDDISALPPAWGLREWDGRAWKTVREASRTEAEPVSRAFLAALLRRSDGTVRAMIEAGIAEKLEAERERLAAFEAEIDERVETIVAGRRDRYGPLKEKVDAFEKASGISLTDWTSAERIAEIGALAKAINALGLDGVYGGIKGKIAGIREAIDGLDTVVRQLRPDGGGEGSHE